MRCNILRDKQRSVKFQVTVCIILFSLKKNHMWDIFTQCGIQISKIGILPFTCTLVASHLHIGIFSNMIILVGSYLYHVHRNYMHHKRYMLDKVLFKSEMYCAHLFFHIPYLYLCEVK